MGNDTELEFQELKQTFAELAIENRILKKDIAKLEKDLQESIEETFHWHSKYYELVKQCGDAKREE